MRLSRNAHLCSKMISIWSLMHSDAPKEDVRMRRVVSLIWSSQLQMELGYLIKLMWYFCFFAFYHDRLCQCKVGKLCYKTVWKDRTARISAQSPVFSDIFAVRFRAPLVYKSLTSWLESVFRRSKSLRLWHQKYQIFIRDAKQINPKPENRPKCSSIPY